MLEIYPNSDRAAELEKAILANRHPSFSKRPPTAVVNSAEWTGVRPAFLIPEHYLATCFIDPGILKDLNSQVKMNSAGKVIGDYEWRMRGARLLGETGFLLNLAGGVFGGTSALQGSGDAAKVGIAWAVAVLGMAIASPIESYVRAKNEELLRRDLRNTGSGFIPSAVGTRKRPGSYYAASGVASLTVVTNLAITADEVPKVVENIKYSRSQSRVTDTVQSSGGLDAITKKIDPDRFRSMSQASVSTPSPVAIPTQLNTSLESLTTPELYPH